VRKSRGLTQVELADPMGLIQSLVFDYEDDKLRPHGGKKQSLIQTQLAELLGLIQRQVGYFEVGRRRVPVSLLPTLAWTLGTSVEQLLGENKKPAKSGPARKLERHLLPIHQIPRARQRFALELLDSLLHSEAS